MIVSDYNAIAQLASRHKVADRSAEAAVQALEAGNDFEMPDPETYRIAGRRGEERRRLDQRLVDAAVGARAARASSSPGSSRTRTWTPTKRKRVVKTPEHRALALDAARQAIVLLQEQGQRAAARPHEDQDARRDRPERQGRPRRRLLERPPPPASTCWPGITAKAGAAVKIVYAEGVPITESEPNWWNDKVVPADPVKNRARIAGGAADREVRRRHRRWCSAPTSRRRAKRGPTSISATSSDTRP